MKTMAVTYEIGLAADNVCKLKPWGYAVIRIESCAGEPTVRIQLHHSGFIYSTQEFALQEAKSWLEEHLDGED